MNRMFVQSGRWLAYMLYGAKGVRKCWQSGAVGYTGRGQQAAQTISQTTRQQLYLEVM